MNAYKNLSVLEDPGALSHEISPINLNSRPEYMTKNTEEQTTYGNEISKMPHL